MNQTYLLFDPLNLGGLTLKNHFVRSAVWMKMADEEGNITPQLKQVYTDLAKGGVGLIITGYTTIDSNDQPNPNMTAIHNDSFIHGWQDVVDEVHKYGAKIALQIVFGGSQSHFELSKKREVWAPSAILNRVTGILPKEMTQEDIAIVVRKFGDAAQRAKEAGFDAVQIHGAHGYLLSQFLSPYYNRRNDEYGGELHNRARIIYEVVTEVRKRVGKEFSVMIKLNFDDFMAEGEGLTFPESLEMFKRLATLGIDIFEPSATNESSGNGLMAARPHIRKREDQSYFRAQVREIAMAIDKPVILMGGNRNVPAMEQIAKEDGIQLFSIGRPLVSEPDLINKWELQPTYKPQCISCNKCWSFTPNSCVFHQRRL